MKNKFLLFFLFVFIFFCESCVSSNVDKDNLSNRTSAHKENVSAEKKLRFVDWKYKGFGKTLPEWVEFAADDDFSALKKAVAEFSDETEIKIVKGFGVNYDQAEQSAKTAVENENSEITDFILFDNFWVKFDDERETNSDFKMPYVSFYLFYKNS